jgi:phosphosulfolactate synthase
MNADISYVPERKSKPRNSGLTMMMDKGLSLKEAEHFVDSSSEFTDLVKFGFGTALVTKQLEEKIRIYTAAGLKVYFGGTLFEMYAVRGEIDNYKRFIDAYGIETVEISDGSIKMELDEKLDHIRDFAANHVVLSEVGSKVKGVELPDSEWVKHMKREMEAGAWKVIAEARESGTIGIYNSDGSANQDLIDAIMKEVSVEDVIWEAPNKAQQVMFIKLVGQNVNLGNIAPNEVVALEALRCGMRGDTFFDFLPEKFHNRKP